MARKELISGLSINATTLSNRDVSQFVTQMYAGNINRQEIWTTAQLVSFLNEKGMFAYRNRKIILSDYRAGAPIITDTGCGNICLAGSMIETFYTDNTSGYQIRITTANSSGYINGTSGEPNAVFIYRMTANSTGAWRRLQNVT